MVEVVLRESYINENRAYIIEIELEMGHPPISGMDIINHEWSEFGEYDYVTDLYIVNRVVYDDDNKRYYTCSTVELNELDDSQLQNYALRMLRENRIGWKLYKVV